MSRVGKKPVPIPAGVTASVEGQTVKVKGPKGSLALALHDDVTATGILLDDCKEENGPLLVIPGSHRHHIYDHHSDGYFCGAITGELNQIDFSKAVPLTGKAGSMSIHHARLLHGSAQNTSDRQRRLLLFEYAAADAWPLLGVSNFEEFNERMVLGEPTIAPRIQPVPVRMPYPPAQSQGSIYENQRGAKVKYFGTQKVA